MCCGFLRQFYCAVLRVVFSCAIISLGKRLGWLLNFYCLLTLTVSVLCFFLMVSWVGLQRVVVVFPGHTHLLFHL